MIPLPRGLAPPGPAALHCGVGTGAYRFVGAMGGDNQIFADMAPSPIATLR